MIILDFGSGNSCRNDKKIIKKMIDEVAFCDNKKHKIIIKWQLFKNAPPNIPLTYESFDYAYHYAKDKGYKTTSSVFDKQSLNFLLKYDIPFVKIPCRPKLYWLVGEIPRKYDVYKSTMGKDSYEAEHMDFLMGNPAFLLCCIPEYPATIEEYENNFHSYLEYRVSDHTVGWGLYNKYKPGVYECHYVLEHDENNPDGGAWARTPKDLWRVL